MVFQVLRLPTCLEHLAEDPTFSLDPGNLGPFAQWMSDMGLVFDIQFTEDELEQLPDWNIFDGKFMDRISSLPAVFELPP
jgi:hypothetical protein